MGQRRALSATQATLANKRLHILTARQIALRTYGKHCDPFAVGCCCTRCDESHGAPRHIPSAVACPVSRENGQRAAQNSFPPHTHGLCYKHIAPPAARSNWERCKAQCTWLGVLLGVYISVGLQKEKTKGGTAPRLSGHGTGASKFYFGIWGHFIIPCFILSILNIHKSGR